MDRKSAAERHPEKQNRPDNPIKTEAILDTRQGAGFQRLF